MISRTTLRIRVYPRVQLEARRRLFNALQEAFPVSFHPSDTIEPDSPDPLIALETDAQTKRALAERKHPWFAVVSEGARPITTEKPAIWLHEAPGISLKAKSLRMIEDSVPKKVLPDLGDDWKIAIGSDEGSYWSFNSQLGNLHYAVIASPVELKEGELPIDHVQPGKFLCLLPLIHFLKSASNFDALDPMPAMASIVFDDPNLHWPSYGHVVFKELARHAEEHDYHAAVAMVPLDSWWSHPVAGGIFKKHPRRLSLLIHGVNHTAHELAQPRTEDSALRLLAQGLRRVEAFEARFGIPVARVMEPPFGVCSVLSLQVMQQLGYSATLLAHEVVLKHSRHERWPASFGLEGIDQIEGRIPAISRRRILSDWKTGIAINLCLGQPIIVAAHHEDAAGDLRHIAEVADVVNKSSSVRWCGLDAMNKSFYQSRRDGNILYVRPFSRTVTLTGPAGIDEVVVLPCRGEPLDVTVLTEKGQRLRGARQEGNLCRVRVSGSRFLQVESWPKKSLDFKNIPEPSFSAWPFVRRILTATRDRGVGILNRNGKVHRNPEAQP